MILPILIDFPSKFEKRCGKSFFGFFRSAFAVHVLNYKAAKMKSQGISMKK
ncbi:hypothetical protein HMPREF3293_01019 [Christensenella minuta]|uniref:Uncharacterized protein n=1 Tax=Christensenella minuta TaxID=626937 RepID=A0A136Q6L6_9FIRM|nr:hypothetical protein HMPREF3293_01019 [Christensenella minuta]